MGELMVEVFASPGVVGAGSSSEASAAPPPPPLPPTQNRRPRVREVSSRFMTPLLSSSTDLPHLLPSKSPIPKHHHSVSAQSPNLLENQSRHHHRSSSSSTSLQQQRRRRQLDLENLPCSDENRPADPIQSSESTTTPFHLEQIQSTLTLRKQQRLAKVSKDNNGGIGKQTHHQNSLKSASPSRPDTPLMSASVDRTAARLRTMTQQRSTNMASSAAAKLLQSSVMSLPSQPTTTTTNNSSSASQDHSSLTARPHDDNDNHSQASDPGCTSRSLSDFRSSVPETDMMTIVVPSRYRSDRSVNRSGNGNVTSSSDSAKFSGFSCSRSLNLPSSSSSSSSSSSPFQSIEGSDKLASKQQQQQQPNSAKTGGICLPPVHPCAGSKMGADTRKANKKVSGHQEDVHCLRMFHNRYLQWRYANAKAQVSLQAQQRETEKKLYSLGVKISELYDSVVKKRTELGILQRTKTLSSILEAQIPYLDKWSAFEEEYSVSLAETVQALSNASLQLPIGANVKVDIKELEKALNSSGKAIEMIIGHVQHFIPKGEEMEGLITETARIVGGERALIEECGGLLAKTYKSQVEECSLRGHLIQLHSRCSNE